ncbi:MAG: tetratricopeptide repeat protein [Lachnospiraceae bacterium]|nr:tetratricopeptide repeat protein [Lachnospiraceae bacterium]
MKYKILRGINILIIISMAATIVYQLFFAEQTDYRVLSKAAVLFITYLLSILGIKRKKSIFDYKVFGARYKDTIRDAFHNDKRSYRRLMKAIGLFNDDKYDSAIRLLDELRRECVSYQDISAVLTFKALCYDYQKQYDKVIEVYEELLKHDVRNSTAWSNLGFAYTAVKRNDKAEEAYKNAIQYDSENPYAYNNIAVYYLNCGQPGIAIEYALKAIVLNDKMYQAMSAAAIGYAFLGEEENAMKYCNMYGRYSKDTKELKSQIETILNKARR